VFAPEALPSNDGSSVDFEAFGKLAHWAGSRSLPQGGNQHDHGSEVNLTAEETHRRRCDPLPATLAVATEAQPVPVFPGQVVGAAPGIARVVGAVQATAARAPQLADNRGEFLINRKKRRPEIGIARQIMVHS
jgi:hypothetical protein